MTKIYREESFDYCYYVDENGFIVPDDEAEQILRDERNKTQKRDEWVPEHSEGFISSSEGFAPRAGA